MNLFIIQIPIRFLQSKKWAVNTKYLRASAYSPFSRPVGLRESPKGKKKRKLILFFEKYIELIIASEYKGVKGEHPPSRPAGAEPCKG